MPNRTLVFTDRWLKGLELGSNDEFSDARIPGLRVRILAKTKSFSVLCRINGKKKRTTIGHYPAVTIAKARQRAIEILNPDDTPEDPPPVGATPKALIMEYLRIMRAAGRERTAQDYKNKLIAGNFAFTRWLEENGYGALSAGEITAAHCTAWLRVQYARNPRVTRSYRAAGHAVWAWGLTSEHDPGRDADAPSYGVTTNPWAATKATRGYSTRKNQMPTENIRAIWTLAPDLVSPRMACLLRLFLAMGGLRVTEISGSQSAWYRQGWLYLPHHKTAEKTQQAHSVPLTEHAKEAHSAALYIASARSPYLFPNPVDVSRPVEIDSPNKAIKTICAEAGLNHYPPRYYRQTIKTCLLEARAVKEMEIDVWQNHGRNADVARAAYDFAEYRDLKLGVARAIDRHLKEVLSVDQAIPALA